nr:MAG TPA: hypothetical protein [Caudoviricetes sp.]
MRGKYIDKSSLIIVFEHLPDYNFKYVFDYVLKFS